MFKIPLDAWIVSVPVAYACLAFSGLIVKTLTADPEMSTANYYDSKPEDQIAKDAMQWNDSVKGLFESRIRQHKFGFFTNEIKVE